MPASAIVWAVASVVGSGSDSECPVGLTLCSLSTQGSPGSKCSAISVPHGSAVMELRGELGGSFSANGPTYALPFRDLDATASREDLGVSRGVSNGRSACSPASSWRSGPHGGGRDPAKGWHYIRLARRTCRPSSPSAPPGPRRGSWRAVTAALPWQNGPRRWNWRAATAVPAKQNGPRRVQSGLSLCEDLVLSAA